MMGYIVAIVSAIVYRCGDRECDCDGVCNRQDGRPDQPRHNEPLALWGISGLPAGQ